MDKQKTKSKKRENNNEITSHERNTKNVISENVSSGADTHVDRISRKK